MAITRHWIMGAAFALAAGLASASGAQAQTPSASAVAAAKEYVSIKGAASLVESVIPGVIETVKNAYLRTNPQLSKDLSEVAAQLRNEFAKRKDELLNELARAYAARFTEQELKDALAFYRTALGKKLLAEEGPAMDAGMQQAQNWANKFSEEMLSRFRVEMKKRGHTI